MKKIIAELEKRGFKKEAARVRQILAEGWEGLPEGWTKESATKYWKTLTGDNKHKITKCMKEMKGKVGNPGAFCGSVSRLVGYEPKK